jgi:hypothetical protein
MNGIQIVLLAGIGLISLVFITRTRKKSIYTVLLLLTVGVSVVFILWTEVTNKIARTLGVGRGADLVFYISILIFWFIIIQLFTRIRKLEQIVTDLIRKDAIDRASRLPVDEHNATPK